MNSRRFEDLPVLAERIRGRQGVCGDGAFVGLVGDTDPVAVGSGDDRRRGECGIGGRRQR